MPHLHKGRLKNPLRFQTASTFPISPNIRPSPQPRASPWDDTPYGCFGVGGFGCKDRSVAQAIAHDLGCLSQKPSESAASALSDGLLRVVQLCAEAAQGVEGVCPGSVDIGAGFAFGFEADSMWGGVSSVGVVRPTLGRLYVRMPG